MKTLVAAAILVMAIASPALAQRAPQQGNQSERNGYYQGYPLQDWYRDDSY